jgi:hypothetical protein
MSYGKCGDCEAFKLFPNEFSKGELIKQCRRHPAQVALVNTGPGSASLVSSWPKTDENQGCCDFLPGKVPAFPSN